MRFPLKAFVSIGVSSCLVVSGSCQTVLALPASEALKPLSSSTAAGASSGSSARTLKELGRKASCFGRVEEIFQGSESAEIVLIQDAHEIPSAQANIRRLISCFARSGFQNVLLEGAEGALDPTLLQAFPDRKALSAFVQSLAVRGEISGGVQAAIMDRRATRYEGVEDWQLYQRGLKFYQEARRNLQAVRQVSDWRKQLESRKRTLYSARLYKVDRVLSKFEAGDAPLEDVLRVLSPIAAPEAYPQIASLWRYLAAGGETQVEIERELREIAAAMGREIDHVDPGQAKIFHARHQAFLTSEASPGEFGIFLKSLAAEWRVKRRVEAVRDFRIPIFSQDLDEALDLQSRLTRIKGKQFFSELEGYARSVKAILFSSDAERELDFDSERLGWYERMVKFKLTRQDWTRWKKRPACLGDCARMEADLGPATRHHQAFYRNAVARELEMRKRIFAKVRALSAAAPGGPVRLIVVSGGFHTEGFLGAFRRKGLSFLLMSPILSSIPERTRYHEHMSGRVSWADQFVFRNDTLRIHESFLRAAVSRLLTAGQGSAAEISSRWKDRVIVNLAREKRLREASRYTRYLDPYARHNTRFPFRLLLRVEEFAEGLKALSLRGSFREAELHKLFAVNQRIPELSGPALLSPSAGSRYFTAESTSLEESSGRGPRQPGLSATRSEVRSADSEQDGAQYAKILEDVSRDLTERDWDAIRSLKLKQLALLGIHLAAAVNEATLPLVKTVLAERAAKLEAIIKESIRRRAGRGPEKTQPLQLDIAREPAIPDNPVSERKPVFPVVHAAPSPAQGAASDQVAQKPVPAEPKSFSADSNTQKLRDWAKSFWPGSGDLTWRHILALWLLIGAAFATAIYVFKYHGREDAALEQKLNRNGTVKISDFEDFQKRVEMYSKWNYLPQEILPAPDFDYGSPKEARGLVYQEALKIVPTTSVLEFAGTGAASYPRRGTIQHKLKIFRETRPGVFEEFSYKPDLVKYDDPDITPPLPRHLPESVRYWASVAFFSEGHAGGFPELAYWEGNGYGRMASLGRDPLSATVYGASERGFLQQGSAGLAKAVGQPIGEEFPVLREIYITMPQPGTLKAFQLYEHKDAVMGREVVVSFSAETKIRVRGVIRPREGKTLTAEQNFGWGFSSMYWRGRAEGFMQGDAAHDSDTVTVSDERFNTEVYSIKAPPQKGEPPILLDLSPKTGLKVAAWSLEQRNQNPGEFIPGVAYEKRPSFYLGEKEIKLLDLASGRSEPLPTKLRLLMLRPEGEYADNLVLSENLAPPAPLTHTQAVEFSYTLSVRRSDSPLRSEVRAVFGRDFRDYYLFSRHLRNAPALFADLAAQGASAKPIFPPSSPTKIRSYAREVVETLAAEDPSDQARLRLARKGTRILGKTPEDIDSFIEELREVLLRIPRTSQDPEEFMTQDWYEAQVNDLLRALAGFLKAHENARYTMAFELPEEGPRQVSWNAESYKPALESFKGYLKHLILKGRADGTQGRAFVDDLRRLDLPYGQVRRWTEINAWDQGLIPGLTFDPVAADQKYEGLFILAMNRADVKSGDPRIKAYGALLQFAVAMVAAATLKNPLDIQIPAKRQEFLKALAVFKAYSDQNQLIRFTSEWNAVLSLEAVEAFLVQSYEREMALKKSA